MKTMLTLLASVWLAACSTTAHVPSGYAEMCKRDASHIACQEKATTAKMDRKWDYNSLHAFNSEMNERIKYVPDAKKHQAREFWTTAADEGDCEDFALAKMTKLLELGWNQKDLRMAVSDNHAVLVVRLDGDDYILDNATAYVWPIRMAKIELVSIQKQGGSSEWVRFSK